jgi:ketosteroid isomerase-like protein
MGANTDVLKEGYEAYGRGDLDAATENWSDDIRWETPMLRSFRTRGSRRARTRSATC